MNCSEVTVETGLNRQEEHELRYFYINVKIFFYVRGRNRLDDMKFY